MYNHCLVQESDLAQSNQVEVEKVDLMFRVLEAGVAIAPPPAPMYK